MLFTFQERLTFIAVVCGATDVVVQLIERFGGGHLLQDLHFPTVTRKDPSPDQDEDDEEDEDEQYRAANEAANRTPPDIILVG